MNQISLQLLVPMIKFKSIFYKNFYSTGNAGTEIQLDSNFSTLIVGKNGSGKTTMIDAICFALFNKAFRNIPKPKIVNSKNKKDCLVILKFEIGPNTYIIKRGIKPDIFEIYINDAMVNQDAASRDYQKYLEDQILHLNYKAFTQIVILGSKLYTPFMELKSAPRREFIEDLLDLTIFSDMNLLLKERIKNITTNISNIENQIFNKENQLEMKEKYIKSIDDKNANLEDNLCNKIQGIEAMIDQINDTIHCTKQQLDPLMEKLLDPTDVRNKLNKFIELRGKLNSNISNHSKIVKFYGSNDSCPTCNQNIDPDFKENVVSESTSKLEQFNQAVVDISEKISTQNGIIESITLVQQKVAQLQNDISNQQSKRDTYERQLTQTKKELTDLQTSGTIDTEVEKREVIILRNEIEELSNELIILNSRKSHYNSSAKLLKDDGIKTLIIAQYLPVINKLMNYYLEKLDFYGSFNFDDNFDEVIKSRHRDEFVYNSFSEGEKMRINLSILFTFRKIAELKNTCNTNLLVMDEITDGVLDEEGVQILTNILKEFDDNNVFVISHNTEMLDKFDRIFEFTKIQEYSIMRELE